MKIRYRYPKLCNGFNEKFVNNPILNFKLIVIQYLGCNFFYLCNLNIKNIAEIFILQLIYI